MSKLLGKTFFGSYFVIIISSFIILYNRFLYIIAPLTWKQLSQKMLSFTTLMHGHLKTREGHGPYSTSLASKPASIRKEHALPQFKDSSCKILEDCRRVLGPHNGSLNILYKFTQDFSSNMFNSVFRPAIFEEL